MYGRRDPSADKTFFNARLDRCMSELELDRADGTERRYMKPTNSLILNSSLADDRECTCIAMSRVEHRPAPNLHEITNAVSNYRLPRLGQIATCRANES